MAEAQDRLVTFPDGFVATWAVVERLLALEQRGASMSVEVGGKLRVRPVAVLRHDDLRFLHEHADEAGAVVRHSVGLSYVIA